MDEQDEPADRSDEIRTGLPELTRKILTLGLGAYFLGEDAVRRAGAKLPREMMSSIAQNASKGKEELVGLVARELSGFLRQMDVQAELSRFVSTHRIKVTAEIEFVPKSPSAAAAEPGASGDQPDEAGADEAEPESPGVKLSDLDVRLEDKD